MAIKNSKACKHCGAPASVFVAYVQNGTRLQVSLCALHAAQQGVLDPQAYNLLGTVEVPDPGGRGERCPGCGMTRRDFEGRGRMGCGRCYDTFSPLLNPLFRRFQYGDCHRGKSPRRVLALRMLGRKLQNLQERLQQAIAEERFEEAAVVRDEMIRVQQKVETQGSYVGGHFADSFPEQFTFIECAPTPCIWSPRERRRLNPEEP